MGIMEFIVEEAIILVPALYIIGLIIKPLDFIDNRYIPAILLIFGVGGTVWMLGFSPHSVVQGILITGATVYTNQIIKQSGKKKGLPPLVEDDGESEDENEENHDNGDTSTEEEQGEGENKNDGEDKEGTKETPES